MFGKNKEKGWGSLADGKRDIECAYCNSKYTMYVPKCIQSKA